MWISRVQHSDLMLVLARTTARDKVARKTEGLSAFIVDLREAIGHGLDVRPISAMINHHSCELFFTDLKVPAENLLGEEGRGFRVILDGMNAERILIASVRWRRPLLHRQSRRVRQRAHRVRTAHQPEPGVQFPIARC